MKKRILGIVVMLLAVMVVGGCSTKEAIVTIPVQELVNQMVENGYVVMPKEVDETLAQEVYRINLSNVEEYAIADTGRSPGIGLVVIAKAKEGKVDEVKASMEALLNDKVGNAFYPDEIDAAANAKLKVDGPYVSLFILHPDVEVEAMKLYEDAIS